MPIQWQNMELHLGGVEGYADHPAIPVGKLASLQNGRFQTPPTISKRYGYDVLGSNAFGGGSLGTQRRVIGFKNEVLRLNESELWAYSHESSLWAHRGEVSDGLITRKKVFADQTRSLSIADMAVCTAQNCAVVVWGGPANEIQGVIIDLKTDTTIRHISFTTPTYLARVVCVGNVFVWFSWDGVSSNLNYATFDSSTTTWTFGTTLSNLALSNSYKTDTYFDACSVTGSSTDLLVAYQGSPGLEVRCDRHTLSTLGTAAAATHTPGETGNGTLAVCNTSAEDAYLVWGTATQVHARVLNPTTLVAVTGILTVDATAAPNRIGVCRLTANSAFALWERPEAVTAIRSYSAYSTISDAGAVSTNKTRADWTPASKPWTDNGMAHAVLCYRSADDDGIVADAIGTDAGGFKVKRTNQPTFTIQAFTDNASVLLGTANNEVSRWWGTCARNIAVAPTGTPINPGAGINQRAYLPSVATVATSIYEVPLCYSYRARFAGTDDEPIAILRGAVSRVVMDLVSTKRHMSAPWGDDLFIAGARPSIYDTHYANEHALATFPEFYSAGVEVRDALYHLTSNGTNTYSWCLVFEWQDANGNIVRSAPSAFRNTLLNVATDATHMGSIHVFLYETLLRGAPAMGQFVPSNARVVPYRAVKDTTPGTISPGPYYRDHPTGFATAYTTTSPIVIGGTYSDADLVLQDQLYTTGDILDTAGTPPCKSCTYHQERLWLFGTEEPEFGWFSQPYQEGEQPRFNEALRVFFGEPTVCGKTHGSNLVVFSENSTYLVAGEGPPATGGIDIGFAVERIKADVGCIEPRSTVWTPLGLMFQSRRGIELLNLSYQVQWVGKPIKNILDAYNTITSAVYLPAFHEVIFTVSIGSAPSRRLIYHIDVDQWAEDITPFECVSADLCHNGSVSYVHTYGDSSGLTYQQNFSYTPDAESTGATFVGCVIVTPWIELNTMQGWERVKSLDVLFRVQTSGLTVEVAYDYSTSYAETHTWTAAEIFALARPQVQVHLSRQKCEAVRFKLTETGVITDGYLPRQGLDIRSLVVRAGFKPHTYRAYAHATQRK